MAVFRLNQVLIRVSGPDRESFLNNLLTQNVENLVGPAYAALLSSQGKVAADMMLWPEQDAILLATSSAQVLLPRLALYKLRAAISLELAPDTALLWSPAPFEGALADPRLPNGEIGYRRLAGAAEAEGLDDGAQSYAAMRIGAGVPDLAIDVQTEEVFASEALMEELRGVDFQKGCFVGQENVSRMKRRATTRRKLCRIAFKTTPPPAYGDAIYAGGVEIGAVRSSISDRGIALLRLDRALGALRDGEKLVAAEREIRLDPPDWLILPQGNAKAAAGDD